MSDHRLTRGTGNRLVTAAAIRAADRRGSAARLRGRGRLATAVTLGAAAVLLVAGCAAATGAAGGSGSGPLKIGMSLPLTGSAADVAKSGYQGYKLWAAQVNASGGLLGRQVSLDVLDDGFDPNQTGSDYTRLISQDKVNLLLGTFSSLLNAPASAIAAREGMLYVEPSGGDASLFSRGFTNLFFAQPTTSATLPDLFVSWLTAKPASQRPTTVAYLTEDDPSASPSVAVFKQKFARLGIRSVYDQTYDPSTTNFDSIAAAVAQARPQMIIDGAVGDDGGQFVQSLEKLNFSPRILFQTNSPADEAYPAAVGIQNTNGIFTTEAWNPKATYPGNAAFVSAYRKMFGSAPTEDAANSYTAGQVLAAAVKAVGRIDQSALATWLHSHTVDTIVGPLTWDSSGDPEGAGLLAQWQNGVLQVVSPKSAATSDTIIDQKPGWAN
ncbi:MAG TPA: amino acid ABC transporter substrate-binding protein [Pseudonocardiaceae bacterium]|jgi:branched-chain amino acid transport system substrate-binding protein|nr:amino acid ABC transporter substrate-binding protein [Pseudonocardiaceae bacterium]